MKEKKPEREKEKGGGKDKKKKKGEIKGRSRRGEPKRENSRDW